MAVYRTICAPLPLDEMLEKAFELSILLVLIGRGMSLSVQDGSRVLTDAAFGTFIGSEAVRKQMKDLDRPKMFAELMDLQPLNRVHWLDLLCSGLRSSSGTHPMLPCRWAWKTRETHSLSGGWSRHAALKGDPKALQAGDLDGIVALWHEVEADLAFLEQEILEKFRNQALQPPTGACFSLFLACFRRWIGRAWPKRRSRRRL